MLLFIREPKWTAETSTPEEFDKGIHWYHQHATTKDYRRFAIKWCKKNNPQIVHLVKSLSTLHFNDFAIAARMEMRGFVFTDEQRAKLNEEMESLALWDDYRDYMNHPETLLSFVKTYLDVTEAKEGEMDSFRWMFGRK